MRTKTSDTCYINNYYTNVTKVFEEYIEFRTGSNHNRHRKTKKSFPKEQVENADLYVTLVSIDSET